MYIKLSKVETISKFRFVNQVLFFFLIISDFEYFLKKCSSFYLWNINKLVGNGLWLLKLNKINYLSFMPKDHPMAASNSCNLFMKLFLQIIVWNFLLSLGLESFIYWSSSNYWLSENLLKVFNSHPESPSSNSHWRRNFLLKEVNFLTLRIM